jgi:hypothetical protein
VRLSNYLFRNVGAPTPDAPPAFEDRSRAWGLDAAGFSSGGAYADLDGDGDLDLVANTTDGEAFVYENHAERLPDRRWLRVRLRGPAGNRDGFGARVVVTAGGRRQYAEVSPFRGYESSVEAVAHFGLGAAARVDSLQVWWPDGAYQLLVGVAAGRTVALARADAGAGPAFALPADTAGRLFEPARAGAPALRHAEHEVVDFKVTPLLPHQLSRGGPGMAVGDVDGNGLDDLYVGADAGVAKRLLLQTAPGRFAPRPLDGGPDDARHEDMGALLFDADGDGDADLYAVSGGSAGDSAAFQDRLYVNDGRGRLRRDPAAVPPEAASGSCVVGADYDRDGDLDLFVCGRWCRGATRCRRAAPCSATTPARRARRGSPTSRPPWRRRSCGPGSCRRRCGPTTTGRPRDLLLAGEWMPLTPVRNTGGASPT